MNRNRNDEQLAKDIMLTLNILSEQIQEALENVQAGVPGASEDARELQGRYNLAMKKLGEINKRSKSSRSDNRGSTNKKWNR